MKRRGNNEGSISKRSDGRFMGQVSMPDGWRRTAYGKTRGEVKEKLEAMLKEASHAARMLPGRSYATFGDFLDVWVINVAPSVKPNGSGGIGDSCTSCPPLTANCSASFYCNLTNLCSILGREKRVDLLQNDVWQMNT